MLKIPQPSAPVTGVILGQNAVHEPTRGPRYHNLTYIGTITKTGATAGAAFQPTVTDIFKKFLVLINDAEAREFLTSELDQIQTRWSPNLSIAKFDQVGNDLVTAVPDVVAGDNTTRTTTFVVTVNFSEPSRSTFADREKFALPTSWADGSTIKLQVKIAIPANAGCATPVIRARETIDYAQGIRLGNKNSLPFTKWIRSEEVYAATAVSVRKWTFQGILQQFSIFSPAGDDVASAVIKSGTSTLFDGTKAEADLELDRNHCNPAAKNADRFDWAYDFSDNPGDSLPVSEAQLYEVKLKLTQAAAADKSLVFISQVYTDLLA